ncbi:MAG: hypothetical protein QE494_09045 [Ramlibacter sp.]|uniref:hypothetical protein n=1 Tax=Ramlibacter sp. TaxID=1917967 RepID=UPI0026332027|nr:hypothetical protein [Ramlibacter sp.]MDH4376432.1 hypothetical protein [Ramlibacter sp.]
MPLRDFGAAQAVEQARDPAGKGVLNALGIELGLDLRHHDRRDRIRSGAPPEQFLARTDAAFKQHLDIKA